MNRVSTDCHSFLLPEAKPSVHFWRTSPSKLWLPEAHPRTALPTPSDCLQVISVMKTKGNKEHIKPNQPIKLLERSKSPARGCCISYPSKKNKLLNRSDFWVGITEAQLTASPSYSIWWGWATGICESLPFRLLRMCFDQASTGYPAELLQFELYSPDGSMFTRISEMLDRPAGTNTSSHFCCLVCFRIVVLVYALLGPAARWKFEENSRRTVFSQRQQTLAWRSCPNQRLVSDGCRQVICHTVRRI